MRRVLPWALLGALLVGVAAGAAFGQAESPGLTPTAWVDSVLAATAAAGSAHLRFSSSTVSPGSAPSTTVGGGVVDFTSGNYRVATRYQQVEEEATNGGPPQPLVETWGVQTIAIGQTVYSRFELAAPFPKMQWTSAHSPRNVHQGLGLDAGTAAEDAMAGLSLITPPAAVRELGPGDVDGVDATRYLVTSEPVYICGPHNRTLYEEKLAPTTVWIDDQGRLLQSRLTQHNDGIPAAAREAPRSSQSSGAVPERTVPIAVEPSTTTTTLTFSDFGAPVHVVAPAGTGPGAPSGSTSITLKATASAAPCNS